MRKKGIKGKYSKHKIISNGNVFTSQKIVYKLVADGLRTIKH